MAGEDLSSLTVYVAQLPPAFLDSIHRAADASSALAQSLPHELAELRATLTPEQSLVQRLGAPLDTIAAALTTGRIPGILDSISYHTAVGYANQGAHLAMLVNAVRLADARSTHRNADLCRWLYEIAAAIHNLVGSDFYGSGSGATGTACKAEAGAQIISGTLTELFGSLAGLIPKDLGKLFESLEKLVPLLVGKTPIGNQSKPGTFASALAAADMMEIERALEGKEGHDLSFKAMVDWIIGWAVQLGKGAVELIAGAVETAGAGSTADIRRRLGPGANGLGDALLAPLHRLTEAGVATPQTVWRRISAAYLGAVALGLVAHGVSGLTSGKIKGTGGLRFFGLAAMIGKLAGFDQLASAVTGTFYRNYINIPLNYRTNSMARPYLPSIGDLIRFKFKRIFDQPAYVKDPPPLPYTFEECMAFYGYSDKWIDIYKNDLYREPMARDLLLMAEVVTPEKGWWEYKITRLGYDPTDAKLMVQAYQRRAARTQIMDLVRAWRNRFERGHVSEETYRKGLAETKISEMAIDFAVLAGRQQLLFLEARDKITYAKDQYKRDAIDDKEFRAMLDDVFEEPAQAKRVYLQERIKRFRAVPLLSESDEVRAALPLYKLAFLAESITLPEYRAKLAAAGVTGDVLELTLELAEEARDRSVLARFQRFGLPALADEALHGLISVGEYISALKRAAFPQEYLSQARALIEAQIERRQQQTVRSGQLPAYRAAYVAGITSAATLNRAFRDAGVDPDSIRAAHTVLDYQREQTELRRVETDRREEDARLDKQRRQDERDKKEWEREEQQQQRKADRLRAEMEKQRAEEARRIAAELKAAAEARRPGWPAEVARINKQIESAYKRTGGLLPDDVWSLGLDLEDVLADPAGPDPVAVDSLIGRIEQALARHAGVMPTPEPEAATA